LKFPPPQILCACACVVCLLCACACVVYVCCARVFCVCVVRVCCVCVCFVRVCSLCVCVLCACACVLCVCVCVCVRACVVCACVGVRLCFVRALACVFFPLVLEKWSKIFIRVCNSHSSSSAVGLTANLAFLKCLQCYCLRSVISSLPVDVLIFEFCISHSLYVSLHGWWKWKSKSSESIYFIYPFINTMVGYFPHIFQNVNWPYFLYPDQSSRYFLLGFMGFGTGKETMEWNNWASQNSQRVVELRKKKKSLWDFV